MFELEKRVYEFIVYVDYFRWTRVYIHSTERVKDQILIFNYKGNFVYDA